MRRTTALVLLAAALALAAAGCGSDNNDNSSASDSGGGTTTQAAPQPASTQESTDEDSGKSTEVRLENIAFSPTTIKAKVGQEIEWENYDTVVHNVVATSGATFKSATMNKGDKFTFTPKKAGTISYVCTFHPNMKATIDVTS